jgi:glucose-1-phosphate cytidylyltransferase
MKVMILCGGYGTRLDHESKTKAKPMVRIGNEPILMHIVKNFISQGINEFIFCLGYKSESIINFFIKENKDYIKIISNSKNHIKFTYKNKKKNFQGDLIFTGITSGTGGRILTAYKKLKLKEDFLMTYGDGLSNVNIKKLIRFHYNNKAEVTLTAVRPKQRYGVVKIIRNRINFFDISKNMINNIEDKKTYWEKKPLSYVLKKKKLFAFKHEGFWKSLDTLKDKNDFNKILKNKRLPWKI